MNRYQIYNSIKEHGFDPNVIVDCGAAGGEWTREIRSVFNTSQIVGIDANKWTDGNIPDTDITEIAVLADKDNKEMIFYRQKNHIDNGKFCTGDSLFIEDTQHYQEHNTIKELVKTKTLKSILEKYNIKDIDLLKIDTQGSELLIMKGLGQQLKNIEFIELEISLIEYNKDGCMFYDVIDFLKTDFEIYDIVELHRHHNIYLCQIDIIFQNKKSNIKKLK